jgi:hypothetical protein
MSFLKNLKSGSNLRKTVTFPGTDKQFELRLLSEEDKRQAVFAADSVFKDNPVGFHNVNDYQNERSIQQLYRVCVESGTDTPIAANIAEFRSLLTGPEKDILVDEYNAFDSENNPSPNTMTAEEFDKLIFDLKKNLKETIGNISNLSTLRQLSIYLANQLATLQTDSGSTSTQ